MTNQNSAFTDAGLPGQAKNSPPPAGINSGTAWGKEREVIGFQSPDLPIRDTHGAEFELPREIEAVGVKVQPTIVPVPSAVAQLGITAVGANSPPATGQAVVLPLTDEQIAQALHKDIKSSARWLAEWCIKRLKELHIVVKEVHGRLFRTVIK